MGTIMLKTEKFLNILKNKNLNMTEASKIMGVDRSHLFRVLNGKQAPGRKFIEGTLKVCDGFSLDELFFYPEWGKKSPSADAVNQ